MSRSEERKLKNEYGETGDRAENAELRMQISEKKK
jgi:hypothetical protein